MTKLTCFKTYDIRGEINVNFDEDIAYRIGRAVAQHFGAKSVVIGFDTRETSPAFATAAAKGVMNSGSDVLNIGMAGTEEMYWAVTKFGACAGIEVTASHNPINYNGMKIVKSGSQPLDENKDLLVIKNLAENASWISSDLRGSVFDISKKARSAYVNTVLSFIDLKALNPLTLVINSGNGTAGPTFDAIAKKLAALNVPLSFFRVNHNPDHTFPNGVPNPMLLQNHASTANVVKEIGADFGVAFDGDFDRCFFFDENGIFIPGEYIVGLIASIFLEKEIGAKIVHDPRVVWNTQDIVTSKGGVAVQSRTGHAFIKQTMREHDAVYGGEMSAHHYFRDFCYCDSGMIPWLLIAELVSTSGRSLSEWVLERFTAFPSSGEINFHVKDAEAAIERVLLEYRSSTVNIDETDGLSMIFADWRLNLRCSNTEPLVRLNIESRVGSVGLEARIAKVAKLLGGVKA